MYAVILVEIQLYLNVYIKLLQNTLLSEHLKSWI